MKVIKGNCIEVLKTLEENSVDSVVTDPPYEIGFMGKSWDSSGIANNPEMWKECLRVLKPGGYLLSFSATRTYHRMAVGIEDAGFEIRDMIEWVYGSGFPKSHNIGKAVDKLQGNEREHIATIKKLHFSGNDLDTNEGWARPSHKNPDGTAKKTMDITKGTSEFEGWGTALKPAHEPICMARKPLAEKTVAENCLEWGTGGINIDESRVGTEVITQRLATVEGGKAIGGKGVGIKQKATGETTTTIGRFPANLIHDNSEEVRECFPEQKSGGRNIHSKTTHWGTGEITADVSYLDSSGNASRFFKSIIYQAKPSKKERNAGCEGLEEKPLAFSNQAKAELKRGNANFNGGDAKGHGNKIRHLQNNHPTVKPIALMEYLINMVTPKSGVVLDPFMGSGTTGCASVKNGFDFIGIDLEEEYIKIATARIKHYKIF